MFYNEVEWPDYVQQARYNWFKPVCIKHITFLAGDTNVPFNRNVVLQRHVNAAYYTATTNVQIRNIFLNRSRSCSTVWCHNLRWKCRGQYNSIKDTSFWNKSPNRTSTNVDPDHNLLVTGSTDLPHYPYSSKSFLLTSLTQMFLYF